MALSVARVCLDNKAEEPVILDVRGLTSYADFLVIATCSNRPQAEHIADLCGQAGKRGGNPLLSVEGVDSGKWVLMDFGDVVAHLFQPAERGYYDLESFWVEAPRIEVPGADRVTPTYAS